MEPGGLASLHCGRAGSSCADPPDHLASGNLEPGFYEDQAAALADAGGGMLLEDYVRQRRGGS
jgi:hypothetical protein